MLSGLLLIMGRAAAQPGSKTTSANIPGYHTADTTTLRGTIISQRTAYSVGIPKILNRIPRKDYPILLENYAKDKESLTLKSMIKDFLLEKGYTDVKTNVQPLYGDDFTFRQCDVAIMEMGGMFVIFIPPCEKSYQK